MYHDFSMLAWSDPSLYRLAFRLFSLQLLFVKWIRADLMGKLVVRRWNIR